jgi:hypothetical protein
MQDSKQKIAAKAFAEKWKDRGYEKGESQTFWLELLHNVLGVENPYDIITFENQVQLSHTSSKVSPNLIASPASSRCIRG